MSITRESIELWVQSKSFPQLEISNQGRVRVFKSLKQDNIGRLLTQREDKDGYKLIAVDRTTARVHRLVAESFIPNPNNNEVVHHKDNKKQNNDASNLEWVSISYNTKHAYHIKAIRSPLAKYVKATIGGKIFSYYESASKCAKAFGVGRSVIERCINTSTEFQGFVRLEAVNEPPENGEFQRQLFTQNVITRGFKPYEVSYSDGSSRVYISVKEFGESKGIVKSQSARILNKGEYWSAHRIIGIRQMTPEEYLTPLINW